MLRGQGHTNLLPEHPIIDICNSRIQNRRRFGKKVYSSRGLFYLIVTTHGVLTDPFLYCMSNNKPGIALAPCLLQSWSLPSSAIAAKVELPAVKDVKPMSLDVASILPRSVGPRRMPR